MKRLLSLLLFFLTALVMTASSFDVERLRVEYADEPLSVETECPRFSWLIDAGELRGVRQKAYRIVVTDESGREVWNSGKKESDVSLGIAYEGMPLKPTAHYDWTVEVWTNKGRRSASSWFETGLMSADRAYEGWSGAKWIGADADDMLLYAPYLSVFRLEWTVCLKAGSADMRVGVVYGANDARLADADMNHWQLKSDKNRSYVLAELDMTPLVDGKGEARMNIFRVGYAATDSRTKPLHSFRIPQDVIGKDGVNAPHSVSLASEFGITEVWVDGRSVGRVNINPVGSGGGDFIAYPVVGDVGYYVPAQSEAEFSAVRLRHFRSPSNIVFTLTENGISIAGGETDCYRISELPTVGSPMLRTTFRTESKPIVRARLYATARGIYDFYINNERVGADYFNPGLTQYNRHHTYQTFDVTSMLSAGDNAMGAVLAEGWWSGPSTFMGGYWNFFGDRQSLLAKLVVTYEDGSSQTVVTDPSTWRCTTDGPMLYGSSFQGEVYDATREAAFEGWSAPAYDDSAWQSAVEVPLEGNVCREGSPEVPVPADFSQFELLAQYGQGVRAVDTLTAVSVEEVRPGVFVYDMGQNMAGVPHIALGEAERGQRITLRFAEVKYPDLSEYKNNSGMIMLENIRAAMAQDIYVACGDGKDIISPRHTYHGYRYVELTGIDRPLPAEAVKGIVLSSIHEVTADYRTSNEKVNRLWENIRWSSLANFMSIPTDCPQRNERLGWTGDISVFSRTATYMADLSQFLRRFMLDMRDTQRADGRFPDVAPLGTGFGGVLWGSAGITVPWECYRQYGDIRLLEEHYDAMRRYIDYIITGTMEKSTGLIVQNRAWGDLGDWLGPEHDKNDKSLLWEAYFIYDLSIMQQVATILGHEADAERYRSLREQRKQFFCRTYLDPQTSKTLFSAFDAGRKGTLVDTQTSYVLPLVFDVVDGAERERTMANLITTVERSSRMDNGRESGPYSLLTGFIGTAWISAALSDGGRTDMAYRLLQQTTYPSWLYSVEQGATTIWERLNSYTHNDGFGGNNHMNSFNHYSFGAVGAWMCDHSLGIRRDTVSLAFKHFILAPEPDPTGGMTHASGHYDSMYGRIESAWAVNGETANYEFTVPANTSATLILDASPTDNVLLDGKKFKSNKHVRLLRRTDNEIVIELQSGRYCFAVQKQ